MEHGKNRPTAKVTPPTEHEIEIIAKYFPDVARKLRSIVDWDKQNKADG